MQYQGRLEEFRRNDRELIFVKCERNSFPSRFPSSETQFNLDETIKIILSKYSIND